MPPSNGRFALFGKRYVTKPTIQPTGADKNLEFNFRARLQKGKTFLILRLDANGHSDNL